MTTTPPSSLLGSLRALTPRRSLTFHEALRVAELQANKVVARLDARGEGLRDLHLSELPRITVVYESLPVSGMSHWNGSRWIIAIARGDSPARQRFTLLHEFKHVIDHGQAARLYTGDRQRSAQAQAELCADYFAGCALVPKARLKSAWGWRIQRVRDLASHFGVSEQAIRVRLSQTGLDVVQDRPSTARCARPIRTSSGQPQRFRLADAPRSYA